MLKKINRFFDQLEDNVRGFLSRIPILYALIGGIGVVLFWDGVTELAFSLPFMNGLWAFVISLIILASTGVFVSYFVGDQVIISGLKGEKKLIEKTREEIAQEEDGQASIKRELDRISNELKEIKEALKVTAKS